MKIIRYIYIYIIIIIIIIIISETPAASDAILYPIEVSCFVCGNSFAYILTWYPFSAKIFTIYLKIKLFDLFFGFFFYDYFCCKNSNVATS